MADMYVIIQGRKLVCTAVFLSSCRRACVSCARFEVTMDILNETNHTDRIVVKGGGIKKKFVNDGVETDVLKGIEIEVAEGEFLAIVGESGSGKSTLLYLLAGIDKPTDGTVEIDGVNLADVSDDVLASMRRRKISFVYQYDNLVPNLTAYENIVLPLMLDKQKESEYAGRVKDLAEYLGITSRLGNYPSQLSGGEQQRVAIARALATNPEVIFLDEPTGSLDRERGRGVMELLKDINATKKVALVMVTHSESHSKYATRIVRIEDGLIK